MLKEKKKQTMVNMASQETAQRYEVKNNLHGEYKKGEASSKVRISYYHKGRVGGRISISHCGKGK